MNSQLFSRYFSVSARNFCVGSAGNTAKPSPLIDSIIRVDHAGELGADRIYAGQMAVLGSSKMGPVIQHMWDQEKVHKATFEKLIVKHRVRPTALVPIWNVAGFLLGAGTALMGEKAAMACTVAVESVIVDHYNDQLRTLMADPENNKELMEVIQKFRDDEQEHHDSGIDHGAEQAYFYTALSEVIKFGCKTAIAISKGLFSQRNQHNFIISRNYSTSTESKDKWDLYSAVCLERKPLVLKPFTKIEQEIAKLLSEIEVISSHKSDHEIKVEEFAMREKASKDGLLAEDIDLATLTQQTPLDFEEASNKELKSFEKDFKVSPGSVRNDAVESLNRNLDSHLLFLIQEKLGDRRRWILPQGLRKESETMRETAERVLREKCGDKLSAIFLGNAPCGFYKFRYPKSIRTEVVGGKIFFFKALYVSGDVNVEKNSNFKYQWATRRDLKNLLDNEKYLKRVSMFLIEDDDVSEKENQKAVRK